MDTPILSSNWIEDNMESFRPPICNKLMHRKGLSVMFVGGPNRRTDFHVDESSEFFFQLRGSMELPIIERGKRKVVTIKEGQVFLLPSRVPHSPQRPEAGSIGLVIERRRDTITELDCMRWYDDFSTCESVQFEKFFPCRDLGKDLVPVAEAYRQFLQVNNGHGFERTATPPMSDNMESVIPDPFYLQEWCNSKEDEFRMGTTLSLFGDDHPDKEFQILVSSENGLLIKAEKFEVFIFQLSGEVDMSDESTTTTLSETSCFVVPENGEVRLDNRRGRNSLTLILHCDPLGNKGKN